MDRAGLRKQIFDSGDVLSEIVAIPEWDDAKVEVRGLSIHEARNLPDGDVAIATLIASCYVPGTDEKVFEPADAEELGRRSSKAITRLMTKSSELNGWTSTEALEAELSGEEAAGSDTS